jgi:hypothetical protein
MSGRCFSSSIIRLTIATVVAATGAALLGPAAPRAETPAEALLAPPILRALDDELSGMRMRDHVARLAAIHRVPASPGYHEAAEYLMAQARAYGLSDVHAEVFPGDGRTWFGTLRGNRGWRVEGGVLEEVSPKPRRIGSFDDLQMLVADNSESADVTAPLVDVGSGTSLRDYEGKDVRGKLVLSDGPPGAVHPLAVEARGAAGLVSYNSNQRTGWWRDDVDLIRWGHLDARGRANTFALMISVREARQFQQRLAAGEPIVLHAAVRAQNDDSVPYETLIATIPGTDPSRGEIVFSCHFDHQKPAANDNASGCSANLEIARVIRKLVDEKRIAQPLRTLRFVWPSEMTGTIAYLAKYPEIARRMKAAIHLDMVGGNPFVTKSVLHITRSPWSVASITDEVAATFARYVIDGAYKGAATGDFARAVRTPGGSKDALWADFTPYESGSDHWIYQEGSFAVPTIYLRDWPDIYIHTSKDIPDNVEPTKIKRAAFIAAASGYYLANLSSRPEGHLDALIPLVVAGAHERLADDARRAVARMAATRAPTAVRTPLPAPTATSQGEGGAERARKEAVVLVAEGVRREQRRVMSLQRFLEGEPPNARLQARLEERAASLSAAAASLAFPEVPKVLAAGRAPGADARVPVRSPDVKGPLGPGSDWVREKAGPQAAALAVSRLPNSDDVTYEIVNLIDGTRTVGEIRDGVSAEFEPVDVGAVAEYLELLAKIGAVRFK